MTSQKKGTLKTFGETIREIRETKGLLLRQVAAELEVDTALISKMERGERKAQREQVSKLAQILQVSEDSLVVLWLSDRVIDVLQNEKQSMKALKHSEKRLKGK